MKSLSEERVAEQTNGRKKGLPGTILNRGDYAYRS